MTQYLVTMAFNRPASGSDLLAAAASVADENKDLAGQLWLLPHEKGYVPNQDLEPTRYYRTAALLVTHDDADRVSQLAMAIEARLIHVEVPRPQKKPMPLVCDFCHGPATYDVVTRQPHCDRHGNDTPVYGINISFA